MKTLSLAGIPLLALIALTGCGGMELENEPLGTVEQPLSCTPPPSTGVPSPGHLCATGTATPIAGYSDTGCGSMNLTHFCDYKYTAGYCAVWRCNGTYAVASESCASYLSRTGCPTP